MGITEILGTFFILAAIQPVIRQKLLESARLRLISRIEALRGSRVILLVHRQETMSLLGFPILRYIDINDAEEIMRACALTDPSMPVDLILHTPGGLVLASLQIARALHQHKGKVTVFVPHYAMSGGTLIALAADQIVMSPHAVLGPVDPQLGQYPAASLLKVVARKPVDQVDDETLIMADIAEKAIGQVRHCVKELLQRSMSAQQAERVADLLSTGTWTHDFPINVEAAKELGLNISTDMPREVLQLMALFPQPVRHPPSVQYIPIPRRGTPTNRGIVRES
ncbi:MAG: ATP-dependent Clp protease proteolytic subunit [Sedimentisphaerales bacterium]|nr:ATP-dependent Clp protease proteolytic subunit [Sedimentisphaerales bacterium]